jgi:hypothetical protein
MSERAGAIRNAVEVPGPGEPSRSSSTIAVVHSSSDDRERVFLATTIAVLLGAIELAQDSPDFCSRHTVALSLAVCTALAAFHALLRRLMQPALVCDGQSLAYRSWLLGAVVELDELVEVQSSTARGGALAELSLRTAQRELYRLELQRWRGEDVRKLLAALLRSHPQTRLDSPTWLWLKHLPPGG